MRLKRIKYWFRWGLRCWWRHTIHFRNWADGKNKNVPKYLSGKSNDS